MNSVKRFTTIVCLLLAALTTFAQDIPDKPYPFRFVNDFAGVMSDSIVSLLEIKLADLHYTSSDQIAVVTVNSFDGETPALYAQALGQKWGIGQKGQDNGVVIIVKPKTEEERGEAFIATGYGQEGALTDAMCTRIVNEGMIPYFKQNDYSGGIHAGVECVISVIKGGTMEDVLDEDFSVANEGEEEVEFSWEVVAGLLLILLIMYLPCWGLGLIYQFFKALFTSNWTAFKSFWSVFSFGFWIFSIIGSSSYSSSGGWSSSGGGYDSGGGSFGGGGGGGSW